MTLARVKKPLSFEEADRDVRELLQRHRIACYRLGDRLSHIRSFKLYEKAGFKSMDAYMESLPGPSTRTLERYMKFADSVPEEVALAYDREKVDFGTLLLPKQKDGGTIVSLRALKAIQVEVVRDGKTLKVSFDKATTNELHDAVLRKSNRLVLPPHELEQHVSTLERRLGDGAEVAVRRRKHEAGISVFVPADKVADFLKRLK